MIHKCEHGVYSPAWSPDPDKSPYCSICYSPVEIETLTEHKPIYFPHGTGRCPKCGSQKFQYENDWSFKCDACGITALDYISG